MIGKSASWLAAGAAFTFSSAASAGVIVNVDVAVPDPADVVIEAAPVSSTTAGLGGRRAISTSGADRQTTQTFTTGSEAFDLDSFFITVDTYSANRVYGVRLYEVVDGFDTDNAAGSDRNTIPAQAPGTSDLFSFSLTSGPDNDTSGGFGDIDVLQFDLTGDDEVTLDADTVYALQFNSGATPFIWRFATSDVNTSTSFHSQGLGGGGAVDGSLALVAVIPEPASLTLIAAGGALMLVRRRSA